EDPRWPGYPANHPISDVLASVDAHNERVRPHRTDPSVSAFGCREAQRRWDSSRLGRSRCSTGTAAGGTDGPGFSSGRKKPRTAGATAPSLFIFFGTGEPAYSSAR